jgi:1-acyl-sn-glycerol-3-phosphate acyltransferase
MLQRPGDPLRPLLCASRLAAIGGRALESIGRARVHFRRPLSATDRRERADWLRATCVDLCSRNGFSVEVEVEGAMPRGPVLLVANHVSYIDPVVIGGLVPCVALAKAEVASWPIVGAWAEALGVLFVRRGDVWSGARALRSALQHLRIGISVLGFPEGTTSRGLLPFHRGLFGIARHAGVPIVPVALAYDDPSAAWIGDAWLLPHLVRTTMRPATRAFLRIGQPIEPAASAAELAHAARVQIASLLGRTA